MGNAEESRAKWRTSRWIRKADLTQAPAIQKHGPMPCRSTRPSGTARLAIRTTTPGRFRGTTDARRRPLVPYVKSIIACGPFQRRNQPPQPTSPRCPCRDPVVEREQQRRLPRVGLQRKVDEIADLIGVFVSARGDAHAQKPLPCAVVLDDPSRRPRHTFDGNGSRTAMAMLDARTAFRTLVRLWLAGRRAVDTCGREEPCAS